MTALAPLRTNLAEGDTLAESVYESLMEAILGGTLAPGTPLNAVHVASQLEVSRTPVHVALRLLATDGLVEMSANRRARVREFTSDDLFNVFEMRIVLEGKAAELAAGRMDARTLVPLRAEQSELESDATAVDWRDRWNTYDERFHAAISAACGNPLLRADIDRYRLLHRGFNRMHTDVESLQSAIREHAAILEALETRDPQRARAAMERHIANWQSFFVRGFSSEHAPSKKEA